MLTEIDRTNILDSIKTIVPSRLMNVNNPREDYAQWLALVTERSPALVKTGDDAAFQTGVRELLKALGTSSTAFFHQSGDSVPSLFSINATLRAVDTQGGRRWMFLDVIENGPADRAGIKPGHLLVSVDDKPLVPPLVPFFRIGATCNIEFQEYSGTPHKVTIEIPNRTVKHRPPMNEPRSLSYRMASSDTGVLKVSSFPGIIGQVFGLEVNRAIRALVSQGAKRLIIDLRGNLGGGLGSLRLMSYLHPGKVEIGYSVTRKRLDEGYKKEVLTRINRIPTNKPELLMMALRFKFLHKDRCLTLVTEGLGVQPFHGRTVLLVNEHTRGAAEMVAAFAKGNHLATLVGVKTPGEVLGAANFHLSNGYQLRIPLVAWYTWDENCVEGKGIEPDINVDNAPELLSQGVDAQLETAIRHLQTLA